MASARLALPVALLGIALLGTVSLSSTPLAAQEPKLRFEKLGSFSVMYGFDAPNLRERTAGMRDEERVRVIMLSATLGRAMHLAFSPDGRSLAAACSDQLVVADLEGTALTRLAGEYEPAAGIAGGEFWLLDESRIFRWHPATGAVLDERSFGEERRAVLREPVNFSYAGDRETHAGALLRNFAVLGEGESFVIRKLSDELSIRLLDSELEPEPAAPTEANLGSITKQPTWMAISPDQERCAVVFRFRKQGPGIRLSYDEHSYGMVLLFDRQREQPLELQCDDYGAQVAAFSPTGKWLAISASSGLSFFDTGRLQKDPHLRFDDLPQSRLCWLDFVAEDLLLAHDSQGLHAWSFPELEPVELEVDLPRPGAKIHGKTPALYAADLSPDRSHLALARGEQVAIYAIRR